MTVSPQYLKFQSFAAFLDEEIERTKVSLVDMEQFALPEVTRMWTRVRAAESAFKEDKVHEIDLNLKAARQDFFYGVNAVNKKRKENARRGI
jgi:hypothetical protein